MIYYHERNSTELFVILLKLYRYRLLGTKVTKHLLLTQLLGIAFKAVASIV